MTLREFLQNLRAAHGRQICTDRLAFGSEDATVIAPLLPLIMVVPRSKANIFTDETHTEIRDLLPDYEVAGVLRYPLAAMESRFYIDIATDRAGIFTGHRKLTAIVVHPDGVAAAGKPVEWIRTGGSAELTFLDAGGTSKDRLVGGDAIYTDNDGFAEVTIIHPAKRVAQADRQVTIQAVCDGERCEITVELVRNDAITQVDGIARRSSLLADHLWVYEPDSTEQSPANEGIRLFQEIVNEVVSRHRGINNYQFIPLDGIFKQQLRRAIGQYLQQFTAVAGGDYPYNLSRINLSQHLRDYIAAEYAPFNPNDAANLGWIVDRRLLIGDHWDLDPTQIDGLWELERAVVQRLKDEMNRTATLYLNENPFWLHRPHGAPYFGHVPYQPSNQWQFRVTANAVTVKTGASAAAADLVDVSGNAVAVAAGERFPSPAGGGAWAQIQHPLGVGWVPSNAGRRIRNDQSVARNHGNHGGNGVAYSYGCKDLPARYANRLTTNPQAPPEDGPGNMLCIAHWSEYQIRHKVGRKMADGNGWPANNQGDNRIAYHSGCDCGGFVQNCITEARFANGVRVVPDGLLRAIAFGAAWEPDFPQHAIASTSFIGNYARRIPQPGNIAERQWVRFGDIVDGPGHVVWVAEDLPTNNARILANVNTFEVFQEKGSDRYYLANGAVAPIDNTRFLRKAVRTPFHYESICHTGPWRVGKVYIWR